MRIVVFGDSIIQGYFDGKQAGWCNRLARLAMEREVESDHQYNKAVFNLGISGDTSADILKRARVEIEARLVKYPTEDFDVAVLAVGVNDSQFDMDTKENEIAIEETIKNLTLTIESLNDYVEKVVIVGLAPVFDERVQPMSWKKTHGYSSVEIAKYSKAIENFASDNDHIFISLEDVYEGREEAVLPDGIHPNAEGHELIFNRIKTALEAEAIL